MLLICGKFGRVYNPVLFLNKYGLVHVKGVEGCKKINSHVLWGSFINKIIVKRKYYITGGHKKEKMD